MYLNALNNQVVPDSEMISLNNLPDDVPLDVKFTLNQTVHELQVQAKHKLRHTNTQRRKLKKLTASQNKSPCSEANQMLNGARKHYTQRGKQLFAYINY